VLLAATFLLFLERPHSFLSGRQPPFGFFSQLPRGSSFPFYKQPLRKLLAGLSNIMPSLFGWSVSFTPMLARTVPFYLSGLLLSPNGPHVPSLSVHLVSRLLDRYRPPILNFLLDPCHFFKTAAHLSTSRGLPALPFFLYGLTFFDFN